MAVTEDNHNIFLLENKVFYTKEEGFLNPNIETLKNLLNKTKSHNITTSNIVKNQKNVQG